MILLSHPTLNDAARHAASALHRAGVLGEIWSVSSDESAGPVAFAAFADADGSLAPSGATARPALGSDDDGHRDFGALCRSLDSAVSSRIVGEQFQGVYAPEGCAEQTFRAAGERGLLRILDVASRGSGAEGEICAEEADLQPTWAATLDPPILPARSRARRAFEFEQADLVFVTTSFLLRQMEQMALPGTAVALLPPPWAPPPGFIPMARTATARRKLRALFVGPLSQRKGLSYLFEACRQMHVVVDLTVIGRPPTTPCAALERALQDVTCHPPCAHEELGAALADHDVLIAPSLYDGFDPVLLEALAAGLPVIATTNTAAPDILDDGAEGFIVPIRSSDAIAEKLELLYCDPELRAEMSSNARFRARAHGWEKYERTLAASVTTALVRHASLARPLDLGAA